MSDQVRHSTVVLDPQTNILTLHGDLEGRYVLEEERPDGALVIRPDLSLKGILERHGERQLTGEEIPAFLRDLPTDDEG
ncbi:hypothetical protein GKE82_26010 [Conexibacter sp. W3-3-2]|uniref:hypothetical protein n=1 Tax=Conexibacter sp. W3-3-2 TaxID=2675227 RepID=UPI0012B6D79A|nr:hypothetical protein [Conexibacter sp. W3-3-2]MTD47660.1 hypothetical protein [Conexibacter sp. W3-3-2]